MFFFLKNFIWTRRLQFRQASHYLPSKLWKLFTKNPRRMKKWKTSKKLFSSSNTSSGHVKVVLTTLPKTLRQKSDQFCSKFDFLCGIGTLCEKNVFLDTCSSLQLEFSLHNPAREKPKIQCSNIERIKKLKFIQSYKLPRKVCLEN